MAASRSSVLPSASERLDDVDQSLRLVPQVEGLGLRASILGHGLRLKVEWFRVSDSLQTQTCAGTGSAEL